MNSGKKHRRRRALLTALALLAASVLPVPALALDAAARARLSTAALLAEQDMDANLAAIRVLIDNCLDAVAEDDPARGTLNSVKVLLDSGNASAEAVAVLLRAAVDAGSGEPEAPAAREAPVAPEGPAIVPEAPAAPDEPAAQGGRPGALDAGMPGGDALEPSLLGLPVFEVDAFIKAVFQNEMLVDVPRDWGNNASGRALTSYSPVNDSGAISPSAGTLTISYFPAEGNSDAEAFDNYTKNIAGMSVTADLTSEDVTAASLPARKIDFSMNVGANRFLCETVCFAYGNTIYAIELMQGQQTEFDYFPVYHQIVRTAEVGDEQRVAEALAQNEAQTAPAEKEDTGRDRPSTVPAQAPTAPPAEPAPGETDEDISSFRYCINGHVYQFPTPVGDLAPGDLPLDFDAMIPYDYCSDADMVDGPWTEIVNTQYYYFENALHKEMAGVTNMIGYLAYASECVMTALIDTEGTNVDIVLPGGVRVGGQESDIYGAFPEFRGRALDGLAGFRGNELLYACNVRDDGCHGYVLIRNDAPFYSAVSIICDGGVIREISYECLGSARARGVFL